MGVPSGRRPRPPLLVLLAQTCWWHLQRNMVPRRLFSVPHLLVCLWVFVLLWGERWVFHARVAQCDWEDWEKWPPHATPHRVVFVADPQLIDAHTYPGRPWPLSALTVLLTDNYIRRAYRELQEQLHPDTLFFLGDLFDGGREWRPGRGDFQDPAWSHRPAAEQEWAQMWQRKYDDQYWLREYARFGDIFLDPAVLGPTEAGPGQRGRRLIASLPGNHDLGFGAEVQPAVRDRFQCFFGDGNRVDVLGNHTFVSVDTVSLSADSADEATADMEAIYGPTQHFLEGVAWAKQKAVARELRHQRGAAEEVSFAHRIDDTDELAALAPEAAAAAFDVAGTRRALVDNGRGADPADLADLPTILLTHVPLFRPPGTPCGPLREHWPPSPPPADGERDADGRLRPLVPDHRNAITVARGYQYQNVLSEADSERLVGSIGHVVQAFSGDDHDYCDVVHDHNPALGSVREITVKALSMAMGVPTPGFLQLSLYNPIDDRGAPLQPGAVTLQTHLCLLPNQLGTFARYAAMAAVSLVLLAVRALLVPVRGWQPFALEPDTRPAAGGVLPLFKAKVEDDEWGTGAAAQRAPLAPRAPLPAADAASGFFAVPAAAATYARGRQPTTGLSVATSPHRHKARLARPRIQISRDDDDDYDHVEGDDYDGIADGDVRGAFRHSAADRWLPADRHRASLLAGCLASVRALVRSGLASLKRAITQGRRRRAGFGTMYPSDSRRRRRGGDARMLPSVGREFWTTAWRVAWMVVLFWVWLNRRG